VFRGSAQNDEIFDLVEFDLFSSSKISYIQYIQFLSTGVVSSYVDTRCVRGFMVALIRADCCGAYKRSRHSRDGWWIVRRRGPQRRSLGGVPGGV